jgi:hypothetical protein
LYKNKSLLLYMQAVIYDFLFEKRHFSFIKYGNVSRDLLRRKVVLGRSLETFLLLLKEMLDEIEIWTVLRDEYFLESP